MKGPRSLSLPPVRTRRGALVGSEAGAAGALVRGIGRARMNLIITSRVENLVLAVDLSEGEAVLGALALPPSLPQLVPVTAEFRGIGQITGVIRVDDAPPIPFGIQAGAMKANGDRENFVGEETRHKKTVTHAKSLERGSGTSVQGVGIVVELAVTEGPTAELKVVVRAAKKKELTRLQQEQQLLQAMDKKKYATLLAQITKAKSRKVEASLIDQAQLVLRSIQPSETSFLNHAQLKKMMKWKKVTGQVGEDSIVEPCQASGDCPCNAGSAQSGEVMTVEEGMLERALDGVAPPDAESDEWLFKSLVKAALLTPEGCVWKSGGKFLLSNEERNQSANAIVAVLERDNQESAAGKGMRALINWTEKEYGFSVTAVQLNFHPNGKTFHKQHRDIYGAGQKGGINCTCSFKKCQGTVCFSVGSSRRVLTQTISDKRSKYEPCGEECTGCSTYSWLHSGCAMWFNDKWNNNHTHGISESFEGEETGPRISIALLCA